MADDGSAQEAVWPLPKFYFSIDLGDGKKQLFSEVSGLQTDVEPIEYRHGDSPVFSPIKMPGLRKVGNVTLKKGVFTTAPAPPSWVATLPLSARSDTAGSPRNCAAARPPRHWRG